MINRSLKLVSSRISDLESKIDKETRKKDCNMRMVFQLNDLLEFNQTLRDSLLQPKISNRYYQ